MADYVAEVMAIADLAKKAAGMVPIAIEGVPAVLVPNDFKLQSFPELLAAPKRARGRYAVDTLDSFTSLVDELRDDARFAPRVYVNRQARRVVAVLNDVVGAKPAWSDLRVTWQLRRSQAWAAWVQLTEAGYVAQYSFAEFLDDWRFTITTPDSATLLELAQNLQGHKNADFSAGKRLSDGSVQFGYTEEIRAAQQSGVIDVPGKFTLLVSIFDGQPPVSVDMRLRWTVSEAKVKFRVVPPPLEDFEQMHMAAAVGQLVQHWANGGPSIVYGTPVDGKELG